MKTKVAVLLTAAIMSLVSLSCKKEGPPGKDGTNGKDGNANVKSSDITSANWVYTSPSWNIEFTYGAITQDIINNGAVFVYLKSVDGDYTQLPTTTFPAPNYTRAYTFTYSVGEIKITCTDSDLTQPTNPGAMVFKVVVLDGTYLVKHPDYKSGENTQIPVYIQQ